MKKILYKAAALIAGVFLMGSCGDFGDINTDPNNPSQATTEALFAFSLRYVPYFVMQRSYNPEFLLFPRYIAERQNVQYGRYNNTQFSTKNFYRYTLKDLQTIINMNEGSEKNTSNVEAFGSNANQIAAASTLKDFYFMGLTDALGMIPYSEALKGDSGNYTPKLDAQKDIYNGLEADLVAAYAKFDASGSLNATYDYMYKGDISKWKKLNATIRMMLAIKLADVDPATGKAWFQQAYKDGGIESNDDNFVYTFYGNADNENPLYTNIVTEGRKDFCPSTDIVDIMNKYNDPRRAAYFTKNADGIYKGIPLGITSSDVTNYNKDNSDFNPNMYKQGAPFIIFSAARTRLVEAEAALRGWIDADAKTLYEEGVRLSIAAKFDLVSGTAPSESEISAYLAQSGVAFTGTDAEKLSLIATQRYINGYFEDGIEAWSDWRRLDAPDLTIGPSSLLEHIPYRCTYDNNDRSESTAAYEAADKEQGADNTDTRVWWDVKDNAAQRKQ